MKLAVEADNQSNSKRKPALQKLMQLDEVTKELRRIPIQQDFLDRGGCNALADWLYPLPDGTYPNVKVVNEILQVVDTLDINSDLLSNSKLGRMIKIYAKNKAKMPQVVDLAKRIEDKWSRMIFGISTRYYDGDRGRDDDEIGENNDHDQDQYRRMRQRLERMKQSA